MHLLAAASLELSAARTVTSGAAPAKARPASPQFHGGARAPRDVGCCLVSIHQDWVGVSPLHAPLFEIDNLSGDTELSTIRHEGAFPQWQVVFPTGWLRCSATGRKSSGLKLPVRQFRRPRQNLWPGFSSPGRPSASGNSRIEGRRPPPRRLGQHLGRKARIFVQPTDPTFSRKRLGNSRARADHRLHSVASTAW